MKKLLIYILLLLTVNLSGQKLGIIAASGSGGGTPSSLLTGLISYWKLNETSGQALDSKALNNLTNNTATQNQGGIIGPSYLFNGISSYLGPVTSSAYHFASTMSVCAWVKTTSTASVIFIASDYYWDGEGWILSKDDNNLANFMTWDIAQTTPLAEAASSMTITNGAWHLLVGTFDGTNAKIYVDGSLAGTSAAWAHNIAYNASGSFTIGSDEGIQNYFGGNIDEVGIWNRVLSTGEITTLWNGGAGKTYPF
jgi:hypothetical protein